LEAPGAASASDDEPPALRGTLLLISPECPDSNVLPAQRLACRIFRHGHKHRPVVTAHADMTTHQSKQEQGPYRLPPRSGGRGVDLGTPAIRTIFKADSSHVVHWAGYRLATALDAFVIAGVFELSRIAGGYFNRLYRIHCIALVKDRRQSHEIRRFICPP
jgi:hypothetical protein